MKAINYLYKICCLIFGHEYKNIGNQNGRYLKCVRCGQRINKDKWEHNAIVFGEKAKRANSIEMEKNPILQKD